MERSIHLLLKQHSDAQPASHYFLFCNLLQIAATTIHFFLVPYFVLVLKLTVVQSGLLLSVYGLGIWMATYFKSSMNHAKIQFYALLCSTLSLGNFLMMTSFVPLIFNVLLLGFGSALFKKNISHLTYKQTKSLYWSSELGLGLALLGILAFPVVDFTIGFLTAFVLSALSFGLSTINFSVIQQSSVIASVDNTFPKKKNALYFYLALLFLGGLLLSQLTVTYGLYLVVQFPNLGTKALAMFMLVHGFILCFLQKPILFVFHRSDPLFRGGYGALLLGLSAFAFNLGDVLTVVLFSAAVYSLGEIFFIGALYKVCQRNNIVSYFSKTLTVSLILGASLGTYVYQYFGAKMLWQACASLGVLCFALGIVGMCLRNKINL